MTIKTERSTAREIRNNAWGGAISTLETLTDGEIETIVSMLEECYPDGMDEVEFNDFWWFDTDYIAELLGYSDYETLYEKRR